MYMQLFEVFSEYGINESLLETIIDFTLKVDSESYKANEHIPQGCYISPLLFIILMFNIINRASIQRDIEGRDVINLKVSCEDWDWENIEDIVEL